MSRPAALTFPNVAQAALSLATFALALAMPLADAPLSAPEPGQATEPAHWAILALVFTALSGSMLMSAFVYAAKVLPGYAWALVKLAARIVRDEIVKWIILAGAASVGILRYLECLPAFL